MMKGKKKPRTQHKRALLRLLRFLETSKGNADWKLISEDKLSIRNAKKTATFVREVLELAVSDGSVVMDRNRLTLTSEGRARLRRELYPDIAYIAQHGEIRIRETDNKQDKDQKYRNEGESPLKRLYLRKDKNGNAWIDDNQFLAGERLRRDFEIAQLQPSISANWSEFGSPVVKSGIGKQTELSDFALDSRERVEAAIAALDGELAGLALDICCFLKGLEQVERERGWPRRSAKLMLRAALSCLVVHYGLGPGSGKKCNRILHWGDGAHIPSI